MPPDARSLARDLCVEYSTRVFEGGQTRKKLEVGHRGEGPAAAVQVSMADIAGVRQALAYHQLAQPAGQE